MAAEIIIELQEAFRDALYDHAKARGAHTLDKEIAFDLYLAFRNVAAGHEDQRLKPQGRTRGGQPKHPDEHGCIADAVKYIRACKINIVKDTTPIETIIKVYSANTISRLNHRTIERWLKEPEFAKYKPRKTDDLETITRVMRFSGHYYSRNFLKSRNWAKSKTPALNS